MKIDTDLNTRDIPELMDWIGTQIGGDLRKRVEDFQRRERKNPLFGWYCRQAFALEFALEGARHRRRVTGRPPRGDPYDAAYGFVAMLQRLHQRLEPGAAEKLSRRLRGAVKDPYGLRPVAYEIQMFTHLQRKGFDVECPELSGPELPGVARPDFLATTASSSIEVECKTAALDAGRKIHLNELSSLGGQLWPVVGPLLDRGGTHLIRIVVPNRLAAADDDLRAIVGLVASALSEGRAEGEAGAVDYKVSGAFPPARHEDVERRLREMLRLAFGDEAGSIMFHGREHSAVAVVAKSAREDEVLDALAQQAKKAADQCSGTCPAVVAMQISGISREQLGALVTGPSGLHYIARQILGGEGRRHVDSVVFTTTPITQSTSLLGVTEAGGHAGVIENPNPAYPCAVARTLFTQPLRIGAGVLNF